MGEQHKELENPLERENIRLEEAMLKGSQYSTCSWYVYGLHVEAKGLPDNVKVHRTLIMKSCDTPYEVWLSVYRGSNENRYMKKVQEFASLEDMQKKYPNLFEMSGILFAF